MKNVRVHCFRNLIDNNLVALVWVREDIIHLLLYSWNLFPTARALIGYFGVTWHLTMKLFPAKNLWAGNFEKSMTSEGNSAPVTNLVPRPSLLFLSCRLSPRRQGRKRREGLGTRLHCYPRMLTDDPRCTWTERDWFVGYILLRRRANARNVSFSNSLRRLIYLYQLQVDNQLVV